ncbi:hypothetical protein [Streptomyces sp. enrichment culture]|uniref:hypothetical protein n=1 Tax=Streptomyces sp. enrichment culture TaxID=1795815 RepID=UPI003F56EE6E
MSSLDLAQGSLTTRADLAAAYGGSPYGGGIVPANQTKNIFVFSDPAAGKEHDYTFDGRADDDAYGVLYLYTGAGQPPADQELTERLSSWRLRSRTTWPGGVVTWRSPSSLVW